MAAAFDIFNQEALGKQLSSYWTSPNFLLCKNKWNYTVIDMNGNVIHTFRSDKEPTLFTYQYPTIEISFDNMSDIEINVITGSIKNIMSPRVKKPIQYEPVLRKDWEIRYQYPLFVFSNLVTGKSLYAPRGFHTGAVDKSTVNSWDTSMYILHSPEGVDYLLNLSDGKLSPIPGIPLFLA